MSTVVLHHRRHHKTTQLRGVFQISVSIVERAGYIQEIGCLNGEFLLQLCAPYVWDGHKNWNGLSVMLMGRWPVPEVTGRDSTRGALLRLLPKQDSKFPTATRCLPLNYRNDFLSKVS
ncbi:hypothetical protein KY290_021496 [Solanum tuberosum]|uniref:Uncharacterized protein n=1 Tax=Solanum tuberosum TaxID=4113 RepID=A0ABQ7V3V0_SOLTU|nr:hypothetical protein KY284_020477 [Solanum tuberosum]KAH0693315.1 hypothetical protein KY285_020412 [Solanum tuberosum]KAH0758003.1 hypothetical protein KY290_021496 [Solanum tuberosum]